MRYGHQPLSEIKTWSLAEFRRVLDNLQAILEVENPEPGAG
ncbi:MAG TPA: hypothetical protein VEB22_15460 [Phycisphaerales bacterium]|nr:hypothetical protein [Phycisphaerales bacterium]